MDAFELAYGSVVGKDHISSGKVLIGKNNQDAIAIRRTESVIIAIVCDGCGSGANSEFGARFGANCVANMLLKQYHYAEQLLKYSQSQSFQPGALLETVRLDTVAELQLLTEAMTTKESRISFINDFLLFTCMGVIITQDFTEIFAIGDGFYAMGGPNKVDFPPHSAFDVVRELSFPANAPPYLAYELAGDALTRKYSLKFQTLESENTSDIGYVLLGSDGVADLDNAADQLLPGKDQTVGPLSQFWTDDRYFTNQSMIERKLRMMNSEVAIVCPDGRRSICPRLLPDDTSFVVIRRKRTK